MNIRKIVCLLIVSVIGLGALASCSPTDAYVPAGFKKISDDKLDYKLYVPSAWVENITSGVAGAYVSEKDRSNITFMAFELDDAILHATVGGGNSEGGGDTATDTDAESGDSAVPEIDTAEEYWDYYSSEFEKTFSKMEYSVKGEDVLLSGKGAKKYVYTATVTGNEYKYMQVVLVNAGTVYIFTYTALSDNYEKNIADVEKILGYIEIKA